MSSNTDLADGGRDLIERIEPLRPVSLVLILLSVIRFHSGLLSVSQFEQRKFL